MMDNVGVLVEQYDQKVDFEGMVYRVHQCKMVKVKKDGKDGG